MTKTFLVALTVCIVVAVLFFRYALKIVPEEKRIVLFRLGKSMGSRGPGAVVLIPFIDHAVWVDLQRHFNYTFTHLTTADDRKYSCRVSLQGRVVDAEKSVLEVANLENALGQLIQTGLRETAGNRNGYELPAQQSWVESWLRDFIERSCPDWGFEVGELVIEHLQLE